MRPEDFRHAPAARVRRLNRRYRNHGALSVLRGALSDPLVGRVALVSSFGADSVVLLHMISVLRNDLPVLFVDTGRMFPETLSYQQEIAGRLGLRDVRTIRPDPTRIAAHDAEGALHGLDPDRCCALRKTEPLARALQGFDAWITGRRRHQAATRAGLEFFEADAEGRIKINPLAHWRPEDVRDYVENNALPRHPLVAKGYLSIGCAPCTAPVRPGDDPRAGRWPGRAKTECGIHLGPPPDDGRIPELEPSTSGGKA